MRCILSVFVKVKNMDLTSNITQIKGVGDKSAALFKKLNIETVKDLIFNIPRNFTLYDSPVSLSSDLDGRVISCQGFFKSGSYSSV